MSELSFIDMHSQISVDEIIEYDIIVINIDIEYWYVIAYCKLVDVFAKRRFCVRSRNWSMVAIDS